MQGCKGGRVPGAGKFQFANFTPRFGVEAYANESLTQLLSGLEIPCSYRAVVMRTGEGFAFSLVINSTYGILVQRPSSVWPSVRATPEVGRWSKSMSWF